MARFLKDKSTPNSNSLTIELHWFSRCRLSDRKRKMKPKVNDGKITTKWLGIPVICVVSVLAFAVLNYIKLADQLQAQLDDAQLLQVMADAGHCNNWLKQLKAGQAEHVQAQLSVELAEDLKNINGNRNNPNQNIKDLSVAIINTVNRQQRVSPVVKIASNKIKTTP